MKLDDLRIGAVKRAVGIYMDLAYGGSAVPRRLPTLELAAQATGDPAQGTHFIGGPISIGKLPPGKSITITFRAVIDPPPPSGLCMVSNQGSVSGDNFAAVLTDDPDTGTPNDPTVTLVNQPDTPVITPVPPTVVANSAGNQASGPAAQAAYAWTRLLG